jgi:RNA polymerase sigma-70 factor (ECF subfamily)
VTRELVERAAKGDQDAFAGLTRLSSNRLFATAWRILRDHHLAEDAVQQTLITIWNELPRLRDPDRFEAWSYRLVVRQAMAEARKGRRAAPG